MVFAVCVCQPFSQPTTLQHEASGCPWNAGARLLVPFPPGKMLLGHLFPPCPGGQQSSLLHPNGFFCAFFFGPLWFRTFWFYRPFWAFSSGGAFLGWAPFFIPFLGGPFFAVGPYFGDLFFLCLFAGPFLMCLFQPLLFHHLLWPVFSFPFFFVFLPHFHPPFFCLFTDPPLGGVWFFLSPPPHRISPHLLAILTNFCRVFKHSFVPFESLLSRGLSSACQGGDVSPQLPRPRSEPPIVRR